MAQNDKNFIKFTGFTVIVLAVLSIGIIVFGGFAYQKVRSDSVSSKIYVAVEGEGTIAVIDAKSRRLIRKIDLSLEHDGGIMQFIPHNVQVSPDGKTVWVTANSGGHEGHAGIGIPSAYAHGMEEGGMVYDSVVVIDPQNDQIIRRMYLAMDAHLAHVVLTPDSATVLVTAQNQDAVYMIDASIYQVVKKIDVPKGSQPHGLRISPDSATAYIAMLAGKKLGVLDIKSATLTEVPLEGQAVQTAVMPDGRTAIATLYDTKKLAVYHSGTKMIEYISLPPGSKGPVQLYPTPDSRFLYVADQGYYFDQPESNLVFKVDVTDGAVVKEITAGNAPHGVVISPDGKFVYITNLLSGDVSVIDTTTDSEIDRIPVGKEPNGISFWIK